MLLVIKHPVEAPYGINPEYTIDAGTDGLGEELKIHGSPQIAVIYGDRPHRERYRLHESKLITAHLTRYAGHIGKVGLIGLGQFA